MHTYSECNLYFLFPKKIINIKLRDVTVDFKIDRSG